MIKLFELAKLMTMSVHNRQTHESCTTRSGPKAHGDTHHALPLTIIYSINSHMFCKTCKGFLESDQPLYDLWDMLRKNFKITYILEGVSLKLWWVGSVTENA